MSTSERPEVGLREAALHSVTVECERADFWPRLRFACHAPEGADCRTVCPNPECEEGCYHYGEPGHERERVDYCNNVEWLENADEVAGDIFGKPVTSITSSILISWENGEGGPLWRFAEHPAAEDAPTAGERACAACDGSCGVCPYARPSTPDASGGLSEAEQEELLAVGRDEDAIEVVERIVAARVADAEARARREHGEKIAQAIEALPGPNLAGIARWRSIDSREGYLLAIEEATHIARSLSPDAAEGEGRGEG